MLEAYFISIAHVTLTFHRQGGPVGAMDGATGLRMEQTDEQKQRRQRVLITLQIVRFVVAIVMLALSIYFRDVLLGLLAIGFLILGTATTWLRMRSENREE